MKVLLKNVRLSFPSLFKTEQYAGEDTGKFAATFLIPKAIQKPLPQLSKPVNKLSLKSTVKVKHQKVLNSHSLMVMIKSIRATLTMCVLKPTPKNALP